MRLHQNHQTHQNDTIQSTEKQAPEPRLGRSAAVPVTIEITWALFNDCHFKVSIHISYMEGPLLHINSGLHPNLSSCFCDGRCIYVHLLRHFGTPLICFCFTTSLLGQAHQGPTLWGMIPRFCWIKQLLANSYMFRAKPLFLFIQYETHSWL